MSLYSCYSPCWRLMSSSTHMGNSVSDEPPSLSRCVSVHSSQTSIQSTPATSVSSRPKNVLFSSTGVTSGLGGQYKACLHYSRTMRYGARRCLSGNGEGRQLPGPGAARKGSKGCEGRGLSSPARPAPALGFRHLPGHGDWEPGCEQGRGGAGDGILGSRWGRHWRPQGSEWGCGGISRPPRALRHWERVRKHPCKSPQSGPLRRQVLASNTDANVAMKASIREPPKNFRCEGGPALYRSVLLQGSLVVSWSLVFAAKEAQTVLPELLLIIWGYLSSRFRDSSLPSESPQ